jgi:hypothetical protein
MQPASPKCHNGCIPKFDNDLEKFKLKKYNKVKRFATFNEH